MCKKSIVCAVSNVHHHITSLISWVICGIYKGRTKWRC